MPKNFQQFWLVVTSVPYTLHMFHFQGVPIESHPARLVGSRGSKNRYFDFDKLAEVCLSYISYRYSALPV